MKEESTDFDYLIPRVAAVHDLCGYGNCSLGIALPVLSACGIDAIPAATAVLSTHTAFEHYTFCDLTDSLANTFSHWLEMGFTIDGIYSGFLGSAAQITLLDAFFLENEKALIVVDPVMADHGKIYKTYTPEMCRGMAILASHADILTPNLTEAAVLLDREYTGQAVSEAMTRKIGDDLRRLGAGYVVLKGIERGDGRVYNAVIDQDGHYEETYNLKVEGALHGTGDLFASVVTGLVIRGKSLIDAVSFAGTFVSDAIRLSHGQPGYLERGVSFEPLLGKLIDFIAG
jgi:pyridoxine kinase